MLVQQKWPKINGRAAMKATYMRNRDPWSHDSETCVTAKKTRSFLKRRNQRRHLGQLGWLLLISLSQSLVI